MKVDAFLKENISWFKLLFLAIWEKELHDVDEYYMWTCVAVEPQLTRVHFVRVLSPACHSWLNTADCIAHVA